VPPEFAIFCDAKMREMLAVMPELPTGTVTFLFTDLVTSTRMWEEQPEAGMRDALDRHDQILREAVERNHGVVFSKMGDGVAAAFASASDALGAAVDAQTALSKESWNDVPALRARMGLHTDEGRLRAAGEYVNRPLNRCARLMAVAHGGQILVSSSTAGVVGTAGLVDLGEHQLRDLAEPMHVYQVAHPDLRSEFPPLRSLNTQSGNLPRQMTSFVGREREVLAIAELTRDRALITLTGVGGVGKTRLALQVAADVATDFPGGAWLCELGPITDDDAMWDTLAASFGLQVQGGRQSNEMVVDFLSSKRLLLVLDNCEHLLNAAADVVTTIAQSCPGVVVLATSREGLAVAGEQMVAVPSLGVPKADDDENTLASADAVHLFADRAHEARSDFVLDDRNLSSVAQLCRRLDGIPLAIELAAARVRTLSPEDLVARLDQRFKLLTRGSRAAIERHQTLRNTIDWSYNLLEPAEQTALNRLSVFAGDFDLAAAEAVIGADAIDSVSQLVDKSLALLDDQSGLTRYRMLETIRQYAAEQLEESGETSAIRRRHAEHYASVAERLGPYLRTREQLEYAALLDRETDNLRAALDWAIEVEDADIALRIVDPIVQTSVAVGWAATEWAIDVCGIPGVDDHPLFLHVCALAALGSTLGGDFDTADQLIARATAAQDVLGVEEFWLHTARGVLAMFRGDPDTAQREAERWLALARASGDKYEIAHALLLLGSAQRIGFGENQGNPALEETLAVAREVGVPSILSLALQMLGMVIVSTDPQRAVMLLDEANDLMIKLGDQLGVSVNRSQQGRIANEAGDFRTGFLRSVAAFRLAYEYGRVSANAGVLYGVAISLCGLGEYESAAVLCGHADRVIKMAFAEQDLVELREALSLARDELGDDRVRELEAQGAATDTAAIMEYLRAISGRIAGDDSEAEI
jgi:predicted ATPase/class 3 adenylate cyclase